MNLINYSTNNRAQFETNIHRKNSHNIIKHQDSFWSKNGFLRLWNCIHCSHLGRLSFTIINSFFI